MKTAVILHGRPDREEYFDPQGPSPSNRHWLPWLQHNLILAGILAQTPELPAPYEPVYEEWKATFENFKVDEETALVGHSCGGGFLVRWLSENKVKVGGVALVAPWLDPDRDVKSDFFRFEIDPEILNRAGKLAVFVSPQDSPEIQESVERLQTKIPGISVVSLENRGHFTLGDMKTEKFPELLEFLTA